jgi:4a-hydroxytetrahydrobiopterin dehydratase
MTELLKKRCVPCEGGAKPLTIEQAKTLLAQTPKWELNDSGNEIRRTFEFKNYYQTMAFVNALAWLAHREDHHPDIELSYKRCRVRYSTHAIGGLSENDFICAAKANTLVD